MMAAFLYASILIWVMMTILWVWSVVIKNVSIVDLFWGIGFVAVNAFYVFFSGDLNPRKILILVLVSVWGLRLATHLAIRNTGKGEDFRYQEFRRKYGQERYWWISYFQTFLLQGILIMIVSLPLLGISMSPHPGNKGKVLDTGFWKYTRHPNYFGDSAVWGAYALVSLAAGSYWQVIGSVIMTLLIIKVSGVALLEKSLSKSKPQYREYIKRTSSFFPWFPKN